MIFAAEVYGNSEFSFSHKEEIAKGELIEITDAAINAGFRFPVVMTRAVWLECIESIHDRENGISLQEKRSRLQNILSKIYSECRRYLWSSSFVCQISNHVNVKVVIGIVNNGDVVITIMLPYEN